MDNNMYHSLSHLIEICANNTNATLASQIVSIAIQLSDNKSNEVAIASKMDLAAKLITVAKKKINSEMLQS